MPVKNTIAAKIAEPNINALRREIDADELKILPRDVSPRQYFRGSKNGRNFIVMLYPDVSAQSKAELQNFIKIGRWLNENGIKAPELYEINEKKTYALFEDLGTQSFGNLIRADKTKMPDLYKRATETLILLKKSKYNGDLPQYKNSGIYAKRRQMIDYYVALLKGEEPKQQTIEDFLSAWEQIESDLPPCPQGFIHGDYHLENIIFAAQEKGLRQCALIDYQDALYGPLPYDLLNLLEDARMDVPQKIKNTMITLYCAKMSAQQKEAFMSWYTILAAQFHGRVLGLFIKLAAEQNRDSYLIHIPRLQNYMAMALNDPILQPLKEFFNKEGVDFKPLKDLDGQEIRNRFQQINNSKMNKT